MTEDSPERELDADDFIENYSRVVQTNLEGYSNVAGVSSSTEGRTSHKAPRREIRWKLDKSSHNQSLESIVRRFEDYLDRILASPADSPLRRIAVTPHKWVSHRCPGYLREEITLTADVSRSVVVAHQYPSEREICTICGQLVQYPSNPVQHFTTKRRRQPPPKIHIPTPSISSYVPQPFSLQSRATLQREFDYLRSWYSYVPDHSHLFLVAADSPSVLSPSWFPDLHISGMASPGLFAPRSHSTRSSSSDMHQLSRSSAEGLSAAAAAASAAMMEEYARATANGEDLSRSSPSADEGLSAAGAAASAAMMEEYARANREDLYRREFRLFL